jgi:ABC-type transport system involved in cytochrome c biogenesis ATPase subunit
MITVVQQNFIRGKTTLHRMIVIGLLSTEEEAQEIQFIAKICTVENRIRYIIHVDRIKQLVNEQNQL